MQEETRASGQISPCQKCDFLQCCIQNFDVGHLIQGHSSGQDSNPILSESSGSVGQGDAYKLSLLGKDNKYSCCIGLFQFMHFWELESCVC
jgi:hypothetical protein